MIPRFLLPHLQSALEDTPAILITGPRQCGKSTLAHSVVPPSGRYTLDDLKVKASVEADPEAFVSSLPSRALIDEIQRAPDLLLTLKAAIDRDRSPGRFVLTGSADLLNLPPVRESLAGRIELLSLSPFSQAELERNPVDLIKQLFSNPAELNLLPSDFPPDSSPSLSLVERIHLGGFPEVQKRTEARRERWFSSYLTTLLERDVRDLSGVRDLNVLPQLLTQVAAQSAGVLNSADLARTLGLSSSTFARYFHLLELLFLVVRLPAWSRNRLKRMVKMPKIHVLDSGLAAALLGLSAHGLARDRLWGALLKSFVVIELLRHLDSSAVQAKPYHVRTYDGLEVDLVLERSDLTLVGIEIKAGQGVTGGDFKGLRALEESEPDSFVAGYLFYGGDRVLPFGAKLWAVPIRWLWQAM